MNCKHIFVLLSALVLLAALYVPAAGQVEGKTLTVWLIPVEQADPRQTMDLDEFNRQYNAEGGVTVLNTTVPFYRAQLVAWNPEFASPNYPLIKGQQHTLRTLQKFARLHGVHINVRFVWWGQAFDELRAISQGKLSATLDGFQIAPDVSQVGSTWVGSFAKSGALVPRGPATDGLRWRDNAALRYTTDVRLIFYWKHMAYPASGAPFRLQSANWDELLDSLSHRPVALGYRSPPLALPLAFNLNLLHDYAMLVWAGGGSLIDPASKRADFTSEAALAIPRKLMESSTVASGSFSRRSLLAFPEMPHEEAVQHFLNGEYLAVIEPANFFERWRKSVLEEKGLPASFAPESAAASPSAKASFWDYAGVAVPPATFIGGSDLIVTYHVRDKPEEQKLAFALLRFLATDEDVTAHLAELGALPAQRPDYGLKELRAALRKKSGIAGQDAADVTAEFADALNLALNGKRGYEYPVLAEWPDRIEGRATLEAVQRIWRNIAEGGSGAEARTNLREAAAEAERVINRHTVWWIGLGEVLQQWWLLFVIIAVLLFLALIVTYHALRRALRDREAKIQAQEETICEREEKIQALELAESHQQQALEEREAKIQALELAETHQRQALQEREAKIQAQAEVIREREAKIQAQAEALHEREIAEIQERGKNLVLRLYQAKMHDLTKINGSNVVEFADEIRRKLLTAPLLDGVAVECQNKLENLMAYGLFLAKDFTLHASQLTFSICAELEDESPPTALLEVINRAYAGARIEFQAVRARAAPALSLVVQPELEGWIIAALPTSLSVVLQEWFYNCLKELAKAAPPDLCIEVRLASAAPETRLVVISPVAIDPDKAKVLLDPPSLYLRASSQGLRLIRDILWYGFKAQAQCEVRPEGHTVFSLPIHLTRSS